MEYIPELEYTEELEYSQELENMILECQLNNIEELLLFLPVIRMYSKYNIDYYRMY